MEDGEIDMAITHAEEKSPCKEERESHPVEQTWEDDKHINIDLEQRQQQQQQQQQHQQQQSQQEQQQQQ